MSITRILMHVVGRFGVRRRIAARIAPPSFQIVRRRPLREGLVVGTGALKLPDAPPIELGFMRRKGSFSGSGYPEVVFFVSRSPDNREHGDHRPRAMRPGEDILTVVGTFEEGLEELLGQLRKGRPLDGLRDVVRSKPKEGPYIPEGDPWTGPEHDGASAPVEPPATPES
jgi:hypothetical protein